MSTNLDRPERDAVRRSAGSPFRLLAALAVTAISLAALAAGSAASVPFHFGGDARLRLSWSARPERIEECRTLSDAELALRPEHMRQRTECEGRFATYALEVAVDGRRLDQSVITGGGLRNDRPIHHLRDLDVSAGEHHVRVSLRRRESAAKESEEADEHRSERDSGVDDDRRHDEDETGTSTVRTERERMERSRRARTALPAAVLLDTILAIPPREVVVVTFDQEQRRFVVRRGTGDGGLKTRD